MWIAVDCVGVLQSLDSLIELWLRGGKSFQRGGEKPLGKYAIPEFFAQILLFQLFEHISAKRGEGFVNLALPINARKLGIQTVEQLPEKKVVTSDKAKRFFFNFLAVAGENRAVDLKMRRKSCIKQLALALFPVFAKCFDK